MAKFFPQYEMFDNTVSESSWSLNFKTPCDSSYNLFDELEDSGFPITDDVFKVYDDDYYSNEFSSKSVDNESKVRNKNCMWSGNSSTSLSTSASSSISDNGAALPLRVVAGDKYTDDNKQNINSNTNKPLPTVVISKKLNQMEQQNFTLHTSIKVEPHDDYEQQLQQHNIPNSKTLLKETAAQIQNLQDIPPGGSVLRKSNSNLQQQQQQKQCKPNRLSHIPKKETFDPFVSATSLLTHTTSNSNNNNNSKYNNKNSVNGFYDRPDTPHSLDESAMICNTNASANSNNCNNTIDFTHNVDLRACVMGSNNISLTDSDPTPVIHELSQQLQDTSKNRIDLNLIGANNNHQSLSEVLEDLKDLNDKDYLNSITNTLYNTKLMTKHLRNTSDCDSDEDSMDQDSSCDSTTSLQLNDDSLCMKAEGNSPATSPNGNSSSSSNSSPPYHYPRPHMQQQTYSHSDHSYTRIEDLGNLETPSDSDEEIDVVSIGDKKLPTNPSDKDRRVLQTKVAHKFSNVRVVKTANGVRTIPPRRRGSFELPYTPASISPVKSSVNSRYPSPASTPLHSQYTNSMSYTMNGGEKTRKRVNVGGVGLVSDMNGLELALPPVKKCRGKKPSSAAAAAAAVIPNNILKRHYSFDETADTLEKRNLHNDMERQRRIGLKNLFESLKKQIPSIKDKERAPKVNILREAAKLCETLTRENEQMNDQKAVLKEQLRKRKELIATLRDMKRE